MKRVLHTIDGEGVALVTLNDPDNLNAMGEDMAADFQSAITDLKGRQRALRAVILTGAGRAFSAGGNLQMLDAKRGLSGEENRLRMLEFYEAFLGIRRLDVPLIAAINGTAIGAGLCLACACDIRVASNEAKFGFTFTRLGLHPGMGGTYFVPRILGPSLSAELLLTGRILTAEEALNSGLVSRLVATGDVLSSARSLVDEVLSCGPEATRQLVASLRNPLNDLRSTLEREALAQSINYGSAEFAEGVKALQEKRKPSFS